MLDRKGETQTKTWRKQTGENKMKNITRRKLKNLESKTGQTVKGWIEEIIETHNTYKGCYFWTPPGNASGRRSSEFHNEFEFFVGGKHFEVEQKRRNSCKNVYFSTSIFVDGRTKDIRAMKKLVA